MKKIVISEQNLRKIIQERIFVRLIKESVKKFLIETVDFAALKKDLESAYQHYKFANKDVILQPFDWGKITHAFITDPEARKMLVQGDADGLANKMLGIFAEKPLAGFDPEQHVEKQFSKQTKSDIDDELDAAFTKLQKKAS